MELLMNKNFKMVFSLKQVKAGNVCTLYTTVCSRRN